MPGKTFQKSHVLAVQILVRKEEVELVGLPRTSRSSLDRGYRGLGSPDKVREGEAKLVRGVLLFY